MASTQSQTLLQIVGKLQIFRGLSPNEVARLLKVCTSRTFQPSEMIYNAGDPSLEIFILLQGRLKAVSKSGTSLGDIHPGTCCGEMGVFTGQSRSATVVATQKSVGFSVAKQDMLNVLKSDQSLHVKILQNVITLLSDRLAQADASIETFAEKLKRAEDQHGLLNGLEQ